MSLQIKLQQNVKKMNEQTREQNRILIGKKLNMSQAFTTDGKSLAVTKLKISEGLNEDMVDAIVTLVGKSKGKGWAGVMKKWGFHGGPATRGQSDKARSAGSIGAQSPGRVFKGKKMAGRMGNKRVTLHNVKIIKVDLDANELIVSGPVPGARNSEVLVRFN